MNTAEAKKEEIIDRILSERSNTLHNVGGVAIDMLLFLNKNRDSLNKYFSDNDKNPYPDSVIDLCAHYLNSVVEIDGTEINSDMLNVIRANYNIKHIYSDECGDVQNCTLLCKNKISYFRDKMTGMIDYHRDMLDSLKNTEFRGWSILIKWRMDIEKEQVNWICDHLEDALWRV